jgi:hypothetical protein
MASSASTLFGVNPERGASTAPETMSFWKLHKYYKARASQLLAWESN